VKLNWFGRALLNSPARAIAQAYVASRMERLGGRVPGGHVLEVGCGGGVGVTIIIEQFAAAQVEAIDLDPKMIERARRRLASYGPDRVTLTVGNVTSLTAKTATFDAVFDFGAIHLEPAWQEAIAQVARVLKPGGRFFFEFVTNPGLPRELAKLLGLREGEVVRIKVQRPNRSYFGAFPGLSRFKPKERANHRD